MGDNLFRVLLASAKAKITPFVTKVKMWTSWNFIRTRGISKIRDFFTALLDVRPRHKRDYYSVFGWLVSKRLAMAVLVVIGVLSIYYLYSIHSTLTSARAEGIKTYDYDSVMLRFADEKVRIRGKSGYLAYEGDVKGGAVTGYGTLYNPAGTVVYQGNFDMNMYQGNGTRYYDSGILMYSGNFQENLFDGNGKLYRENGSLAYEGEFALGRVRGMRRQKGTQPDSMAPSLLISRPVFQVSHRIRRTIRIFFLLSCANSGSGRNRWWQSRRQCPTALA